MENKNAGSWQNTIMYMGDDGNDNLHMKDEDEVAEYITGKYPDFQVKKVMWDAYQRETSSVGNSYPDATKIILQQQANGALIMDYAGHGSAGQLSHEKVIALKDFSTATNTWRTILERLLCSMPMEVPWHSMVPLVRCMPTEINI